MMNYPEILTLQCVEFVHQWIVFQILQVGYLTLRLHFSIEKLIVGPGLRPLKITITNQQAPLQPNIGDHRPRFSNQDSQFSAST